MTRRYTTVVVAACRASSSVRACQVVGRSSGLNCQLARAHRAVVRGAGLNCLLSSEPVLEAWQVVAAF